MKYILVSVCILAIVLMSGKVDLNIEHQIHLPKQFSNETLIYTSYKTWPLLSKRVDIYLRSEIEEMGFYTDIAETLRTLNLQDEVYFHLAGYGGDTLGMTTIVTAITNTKASVTMLVEAPVFSAHALLASLPNVRLKMADHTFLMFHQISALGVDCNDAVGDDRGISNKEHCEGQVQTTIKFNNTYLESTKYLMKEEVKDIQAGHDIYLSADVVRDRQRGIYKRVYYIPMKYSNYVEVLP